MPYQSIYTSSGKYREAKATGQTHDYSKDFTPGQYAAVNAPAAAKQQAAAARPKVAPKAPPPSLFNKVKNFVGDNVVKPTITTVDKSVNTVAAGVEGAAGAGEAIAQKAVGNDKGATKTVQTTSRVINDKLTKGAGGKGGFVTPEQAKKGGTQLIKPGAQAVADIAPLVLPIGKTAKGATLLTRVVKTGAKTGAANTGITEGNEAVQGRLTKGNLKETVKGAAQGFALGAAGALLHEGVKTGKDATATAPAKDLIKHQKTQTLLEAGRNQPEVKTTYNPSNPQVKTIIEARQKQAEAVVAPAKAAEAEQKATAATAEKTQVQGQKIDRQVELIKAKAKDSETGLSNVDKTKLTHLQQDKAQLEQPTGNVADVKPPQQSPATVEAPQTPAPTAANEKPVSASSGNSTPKDVAVATPAKTKVSVDPNAPPERGTGRVAQDIQTKAVARGLKNTFGDAAGYDKINIENMAKKATAITEDPERLNRIIDGSEKLPSDVRPTALITAVENHPTLSKDPELINRLSQAEHLTGESSRSAQELRLAAERNPHSPIEAIKQVRKARQAAVERKTGTSIAKAVGTEVKAAVSEKPKVTKETWSSFVDSLKC